MMSRDKEHKALIEAFSGSLTAAMLQKSARYSNKPPLSQEPLESLSAGRVAEAAEVEHALFRAHAGSKPRGQLALWEVADYCMYAAEELRRLGVIDPDKRTLPGHRIRVALDAGTAGLAIAWLIFCAGRAFERRVS